MHEEIELDGDGITSISTHMRLSTHKHSFRLSDVEMGMDLPTINHMDDIKYCAVCWFDNSYWQVVQPQKERGSQRETLYDGFYCNG